MPRGRWGSTLYTRTKEEDCASHTTISITQYHQEPTGTAFYDIVPYITSTAPYWSSTTKYQPVPPSNDPVPSYIINQYRSILTQ